MINTKLPNSCIPSVPVVNDHVVILEVTETGSHRCLGVWINTVTSNNVRCGDVTHGNVTSVKNSPSQVSISERDEELKAEATNPVRSVMPSRGNIKRDVKLTSDVKVAEKPKGGDFHLVFDHTYPFPLFHLRRDRYETKRCWILELGRLIARESLGAVITLVSMSQHCTVVVYIVISF